VRKEDEDRRHEAVVVVVEEGEEWGGEETGREEVEVIQWEVILERAMCITIEVIKILETLLLE
jgi:hypothetical protein